MTTTTERNPGEHARNPAQIPARGWWQVVRRAMKESSADHVPMLAGGVAFFAFLALFPALIAAVTLYGLVADPEQVTRQVQALAGSLPKEAQPLIADQLTSVASGSSGALGIGLVVSLLAALWSASSGTGNLIQAVNLAYDEDETRGFVKTARHRAAADASAPIVFVLVTTGRSIAVVPPVLGIAMPLGVVGTVRRRRSCAGCPAGRCSWSARSPSSTGWRPTGTHRSSGG